MAQKLNGTHLKTHAVEQSTYPITFSTKDETGAVVTANNGLKWSLTDEYGVVVNDKQDVAITSGSEMTVVLQGDDLAILRGQDTEIRVLTIEGTYDSDLGEDMPIKQQCWFYLDNLVKVGT